MINTRPGQAGFRAIQVAGHGAAIREARVAQAIGLLGETDDKFGPTWSNPGTIVRETHLAPVDPVSDGPAAHRIGGADAYRSDGVL